MQQVGDGRLRPLQQVGDGRLRPLQQVGDGRLRPLQQVGDGRLRPLQQVGDGRLRPLQQVGDGRLRPLQHPLYITVASRYNVVVGVHDIGRRCTRGALGVPISATRELLNNSDRHPLHQVQERCRSPVCLQHCLIRQHAVYGTY